ncbi:MAG: DUF2141 domain-containing protein [Bacteroidota bacterium]
MKYVLYVSLICIALSLSNMSATKGTLSIEIENIKTSEGTIWLGIYDSEKNFLVKEQAIVEGYEVNQSGNMLIEIDGLDFGAYAIALFHDQNGNGVMDQNILGIPSEPFAFSKKPKSKWRKPKFSEVSFHFESNKQLLETKLKKWGEK